MTSRGKRKPRYGFDEIVMPRRLPRTGTRRQADNAGRRTDLRQREGLTTVARNPDGEAQAEADEPGYPDAPSAFTDGATGCGDCAATDPEASRLARNRPIPGLGARLG